MRIALAQILSGTEPAANLALVEDYTRQAVDAGAPLVLFPEATMCRFGVPLAPIAEPLDGSWASGVRSIADRAGIVVVAGMFTPTADGRVTNTLIAAGPGVDTHYHKIHLYDAFGFVESRTVAPGHEPVVDHRRRCRGRADHLLRHPVPRALRRAGAPRGTADHGARVVGLGPGQARTVDAAGAGACAGYDGCHRGGRPGLSGRRDRRRPGRPVWAAAWSSHPPARCRHRPAPTHSCSSPMSIWKRSKRPGTRSRCCATARSSLMSVRHNRGGDRSLGSPGQSGPARPTAFTIPAGPAGLRRAPATG